MALRPSLLFGAACAVALIAPAAYADELDPAGKWTAYERGAADLPPMGWNSWNAFGVAIDEEKVLGSANIIVSSGLAAKGYRYINLDEGWWARRNSTTGRMVIRTDRFPSARQRNGSTSFRPLTDRLHAMGLKAGIYSEIGRNSCGQLYSEDKSSLPTGTVAEREVGLHDHVDQDIRLYFEEWGFDYIKVDGCGIRGLPASNPRVISGEFREFPPLIDSDSLGRTNIPAVRALFTDVSQALERHNSDDDFIFSICIWGAADVRSWAKNVGNMSRTSEDIFPIWGRMLFNLDSASRRALYAHPGSWNDPDMLYIGTGDFDADHLTEARTHFSMWAMLNAPLIIGYDLRRATPKLLEILGNTKVIALNQDPAGNQAVLAYDTDDTQFYVKTLSDGTKAVALLNRTSAPLQVTLTADQLKYLDDGDVTLENLWTGDTITFRKEHEFALAPRETLVFKARGTRTLAAGYYISEMPGSVNPAVDGITVPEAEPLTYRGILPWQGTRGNGEHPRYGGWGGAQADMTPYGDQLAVAGHRFFSGIGVLANSRLEVRNNGFKRFSATVGVDDTARDRSQPVTFFVYGDGRLLAESGPKRFGEAPSPIEADVSGVKLVELVARTAEPMRFPDPVTWGEAALTR